MDLRGIRLVWEVRRKEGEPIPQDAIMLMQDFNMVHCVDFSKETPVVESDTVYTSNCCAVPSRKPLVC